VAVQAYHHWLMGGTVLLTTGLFYFLTRNNPVIALSREGCAIGLGTGLVYCLTGVLMWFGTPLGRYLNYPCSLIYLTRPRLGLRAWADMRRPEFKAHFSGRDDHSKPVSRRGAKPQSRTGEN
jgi:hypothetical protein